jgi:hypothetical protein
VSRIFNFDSDIDIIARQIIAYIPTFIAKSADNGKRFEQSQANHC